MALESTLKVRAEARGHIKLQHVLYSCGSGLKKKPPVSSMVETGGPDKTVTAGEIWPT